MQRIKFIDKMAQGKVSRRDMLKSAGAFGVGALALPNFAYGAEPLTVMEWGGYDDPAYYKPFADKYGAPNFSIFSSEEEALAKILAGYAADIMHPCNYSVGRFVSAGLVTPLDTARLSHWNDIFPILKTAEGVLDNGNIVMAPADWGNASIAYRPDLVSEAFKADPSWSIFYDDSHKGRVSMLDNELAIIIGLMVSGKTYDEVYNISGDALAAAAKEWGTKAIDNSRFMWTSASDVQQAMASGEIVAAYAWNDLVKNLRTDGVPVEYARPKEGIFTWFCGLTLLNSGKGDQAAAYDFIDAWLSPETGKYLIESSGYGHANQKSFEAADPAAVAAMGISDPVAMMASSIVFRSPSDEVQVEHNRVWGETKALKL